jgi:predicted MPP superfamily phosphohydrolase
MSYGGQFVLATLFALAVSLPMVWFVRLLVLYPTARWTGRNLLQRRWLDSRVGRAVVLTVGSLELICFLYAWQVEPRRLERSHVVVESVKLPAGERLRIVHLSDLHIDGHHRLPSGLAEALERARPDLVLLTGDYLNNGSLEAAQALQELVARLTPTRGVYAVTGNWDVRSWSNARSLLREAGVAMVDSVAMEVPGLSYPLRIHGHFDSSMLASHGPFPGFDIALHHSPDAIEELAGKVDLYLCGHTHGGQIRLPFFGALITLSKFWKRYEMGRYDVHGTVLYVNRGIGAEGGPVPRMRFLAPPELVVIDGVGTGK